jgi:hypothetical protein
VKREQEIREKWTKIGLRPKDIDYFVQSPDKRLVVAGAVALLSFLTNEISG